MINEIIVGGIASVVSGTLVFLTTKKVVLSRFKFYEHEARAKAKTIEHEAELLLHKSKLAIQELEFEAKRQFEDELMILKSDYEAKRAQSKEDSSRFLKELEQRESLVEEKEKTLHAKSQSMKAEIDFAKKQQVFYTEKAEEASRVLQNQAGMTDTEIKTHLLELARERYRVDIANEVRKIEEEAKYEIKKKANYILAQATTRFAGEFATERLVNTVDLPDNELKGRIIGKEGRNIKTLEQLLGVDILIDDRPNTLELSSHNLYRRAIATRTIELLVEDGRIQPARIEEIFDKVTIEFEERIMQEGEQVIADLGLAAMHPEIVKMIGKLRYRASYGQNALAHTLEVAHFAGIIAAELGGDERLARRAGLLHDIGKSMTHEIGGNHVDIGAEVCVRHHEDPVVINAIYAHHDQEEVLSIECAAVCAADALSAARPGARREVLESFLKRVKEIEEIALAQEGVKQAYAINAGREVRVIINAEMVNASQSAIIAQDIAKEIEKRMQFPGEIKVHVIREERFIAIAT